MQARFQFWKLFSYLAHLFIEHRLYNIFVNIL